MLDMWRPIRHLKQFRHRGHKMCNNDRLCTWYMILSRHSTLRCPSLTLSWCRHRRFHIRLSWHQVARFLSFEVSYRVAVPTYFGYYPRVHTGMGSAYCGRRSLMCDSSVSNLKEGRSILVVAIIGQTYGRTTHFLRLMKLNIIQKLVVIMMMKCGGNFNAQKCSGTSKRYSLQYEVFQLARTQMELRDHTYHAFSSVWSCWSILVSRAVRVRDGMMWQWHADSSGRDT